MILRFTTDSKEGWDKCSIRILNFEHSEVPQFENLKLSRRISLEYFRSVIAVGGGYA